MSTKSSHIFKQCCSWKLKLFCLSMCDILIYSYLFSDKYLKLYYVSEINALILWIHSSGNYSKRNLYHVAIVYFQFLILCKIQRNRKYFMVSILPYSLHTRKQINKIRSCIRLCFTGRSNFFICPNRLSYLKYIKHIRNQGTSNKNLFIAALSSEACSKLCQTSTMACFAKIVNG